MCVCHLQEGNLWLDTLDALGFAGAPIDCAIAPGLAFEVAQRFNRAGVAGD